MTTFPVDPGMLRAVSCHAMNVRAVPGLTVPCLLRACRAKIFRAVLCHTRSVPLRAADLLSAQTMLSAQTNVLSVQPTDVLSVQTTDLLCVQTTDLLSAQTTHLLSVQTADLLSV